MQHMPPPSAIARDRRLCVRPPPTHTNRQAQLQERLAPLGIKTDVVDRCARRAADACRPPAAACGSCCTCTDVGAAIGPHTLLSSGVLHMHDAMMVPSCCPAACAD